MRERPILFNGPMVRAILDKDCPKTQTRRVITHEPWAWSGPVGASWPRDHRDFSKLLACPFGQPGDRLWVREEWRVGAWVKKPWDSRLWSVVALDYSADNFCRKEWLECHNERLVDQSIYEAEESSFEPDEFGNFTWEPGQSPCRWRPSIHMPRWACRLVLENTRTSVERLEDITEADARAEGFESREAFLAAFRAIYKLPPDANPWVWVVEFKRVEV